MRLGKYLSELTKPELEELKDLLNLSDDEMVIFEKLSSGRSIEEISDKLKMSSRTVQRRITKIKNKMERVIEELKKHADIAFETDDAYGSEVAYGEWTAYKQAEEIVEKGGIE